MFILNLPPSVILGSLYLSMFSRSCLARFVSTISEVWSCHIGTVVYMHMTGTTIFRKQIFDFLYSCDYLSASARIEASVLIPALLHIDDPLLHVAIDF